MSIGLKKFVFNSNMCHAIADLFLLHYSSLIVSANINSNEKENDVDLLM